MGYTLEWDDTNTIASLSQWGHVTLQEMQAMHDELFKQCDASLQPVHLIIEFIGSCTYATRLVPLRKFGKLHLHPCMGITILINPPTIMRFFASMTQKWYPADIFIVNNYAEALILLRQQTSH